MCLVCMVGSHIGGHLDLDYLYRGECVSKGFIHTHTHKCVHMYIHLTYMTKIICMINNLKQKKIIPSSQLPD